MNLQDIAKLSKDLYTNKALSFNEKSGQDVMREVFFNVLGVPAGTTGQNMLTAFNKNRYDVYQVISTALTAAIPAGVKGKYDNLANTLVIGFSDVARFTNRNRDLFRVALIAAGTQDLRRQEKLDAYYTLETDKYGVKVYTELEQFLNGQTDWTDYVDRIRESFENFVGERIYDAITKAYDALSTPYKENNTGSFDVDKTLALAERVSAKANAPVAIYGTISALNKLTGGIQASDNMKDERNQYGYLKTFNGIPLVAIPQGLKNGKDEFAISDKALLVIPNGEKVVDVALKGDVLVVDAPATEHNALQPEYLVQYEIGVAARKAAVFGVSLIS